MPTAPTIIKSGAVSVKISQYADGRFFFRRKVGKRWKTVSSMDREKIEKEARGTAKVIALQKTATLGLNQTEVYEFLKWRDEQQKAIRLETPLAEYIDKKTVGMSERYARSVRALKAILAPLASENIRQIGQDDIEPLLPPVSRPRRRNNVLDDISTFFRWCRKRQILPEGMTAPERIDRETEPPPKKLIFTVAEFREIARQCSDEWKPWLAIACFAGVRTEEIQRLQWENISLDRGVIDVMAENAKTRRRRLVPISENLKSWLRPHAKKKGEIAPDRIDNYIRHLTGWKINAPRHSYGSYRLAVIQNAAQLAEEMGNSVAMIRKHYAEAVHPEEGAAWFEILP